MFNNKLKDVMIRPLLLGALCLALGGGLLLYYYKFAQEKSTASFVVSYAVVIGGLVFLILAVVSMITYLKKQKVLKDGQEISLKYLSHETITSTKNQNFYKITFSYILNNEEKTITSSSEFVWAQVVTIKAAETLNAKVLNKRVVITDDLQTLYMQNEQKIKEIEKKYHEAYSALKNIIK